VELRRAVASQPTVKDSCKQLLVRWSARLRSLKIREHFLTKLFTLAKLREARRIDEMHELVRFHTENKFLLMAYSQKELKVLGNLVANREKKPLSEIAADYENHLHRCMENPPRRASNINVLMHILGYFSKQLSKNERQFFLETLELYRDGRVPFTSALRLVKSWAVRFENEYLLSQTFFDPYPSDLMEWSDAGRPIEL
jgi:uncharacterized protein YbgA (DUF1722 family)